MTGTAPAREPARVSAPDAPGLPPRRLPRSESVQSPRMPRPHETKRTRAVTRYDELTSSATPCIVGHRRHAQRSHPRSEALVAEQRPHHILHAGDIGDLRCSIASQPSRPSAVRGNIDGHGESIPDARVIAVRVGESTLLRMLLCTSPCTGRSSGPTSRERPRRRTPRSSSAATPTSLSLGRDRGVAMFNPGSIGRGASLPILSVSSR